MVRQGATSEASGAFWIKRSAPVADAHNLIMWATLTPNYRSLQNKHYSKINMINCAITRINYTLKLTNYTCKISKKRISVNWIEAEAFSHRTGEGHQLAA